MSRILKFRAWLKPRWDDDIDANKMYYDIQNSYDTLGDVKPYDPMGSFDEWLNDEVAIIEQYTGLKDKNGKEIYEGDIVVNTYYDDGEMYKILWVDDSVAFGMESLDDMELYKLPLESLEVIGNIHENAELLG